MSKILLLNGPNLNLLGIREPQLYGVSTLAEIEASARVQTEQAGFEFSSFQSNSEAELIEQIHHCLEEETAADIILFNPAAFTHTSVALRDALLAVAIPFIEIHLSDLKSREAFRQHSFFSDIALEIYSGYGAESYTKAIKAAVAWLQPH
jgi:3-dehydroquinate dehydratase-2